MGARECSCEHSRALLKEYVYDTKLERNDLHDKIWEKLEFREGVKEFTDGSTCNIKILIFWGKCSFTEGFDRSYLLNKKNWPPNLATPFI